MTASTGSPNGCYGSKSPCHRLGTFLRGGPQQVLMFSHSDAQPEFDRSGRYSRSFGRRDGPALADAPTITLSLALAGSTPDCW